MEIELKVKRFDPEDAKNTPYFKDYKFDIEESATVLDSLIKIREEIDGTLTFRCSCRSAICGSCAMVINGQAGLACNTKLLDLTSKSSNEVLIEPLNNLPIIKDLVADFKPFWNKIDATNPWLQPNGTPPKQEYMASNEAMLNLANVMACIMCGACVSDCTVLNVDSNFLGPAALAKSYRFIADPRDDADKSRLSEMNESGGVWDCTRCMQCVEVCPKGVDPMGKIMETREKIMEAGMRNTFGAKHATAVSNHIEHSGRIDEFRLPLQSKGIFNFKEIIKLMLPGLRFALKKRAPSPFHFKNPNQTFVKKLFKKVEK